MMRPEDIRGNEDRSRLLKVLGAEKVLNIKKRYQPIEVQNGDAFLVCSDSFWEYVYETEMEMDLLKSDSVEVWLKYMLKRHILRAENKGDNYTAICGIIHLEEGEAVKTSKAIKISNPEPDVPRKRSFLVTPIEQYTKKGKQGAWTDIYSLGVSMYYALTKVIIDDPYARMDSDEEFEENKYKINESLLTIIKKCTIINASDRYGSAIDLRKALKSVSAPLTAEMIELSAEDLKDEPEEKEDTAAHTTAAPLDDDIPVTVAGSASDIAEEIEIFESSAPDESTGGAPDTSAPITVEQAKPSKKGKLIAAICSAAALVIVVVICVVVGINRRKAPDITSEPSGSASNGATSDGSSSIGSFTASDSSGGTDDGIIYNPFYPEMKDGKLFFEMDSSYPANGRGKQISKDNLMRFDGDVKVTLELEHIPSLEWAGDNIRITDSIDRWVEVMAFNKGISVNDVDPEATTTVYSPNKQSSHSL